MPTRARPLPSHVCHALVVAALFTLLFAWLFARPFIEHAYLIESDLFDSFLPRFLGTFSPWSSAEWGGYLYAAQSDHAPLYPVNAFFRWVVQSWNGYIVSAYVIAACGTYAYLYSLTRSRLAAAFAGATYALSEAMMERIAHINLVHEIAWIPVLFLVIDRMRASGSLRWVAVGGFTAGSMFLIGQPQLPLYACLAAAIYAVIGGVAGRAGRRYWLSIAGMFVLGSLLSAAKTFPQLEVSSVTARQFVSFDLFVSHSNTPAQMWSVLFPRIEHEGREAPTYVGVAGILLTLVALSLARRNWRVTFWLLVTLVGLVLGAGDATPLSVLAYKIPLYDRFRIVARHLALAAFGMAALAGFSVAALQRREVRGRGLAAALLIFTSVFVVGALALRTAPPDLLAASYAAVVVPQLAIAAAAAVACVAVAVRPGHRLPASALIVVAVFDLVHALPYGVSIGGLEAPVLAWQGTQPSVHVRRLSADLARLHQRLLSPFGTGADELVPAGYGRLWNVPLLGGFGQLLPARHSALAMMQVNGRVDPIVLTANPTLDLLAVKYLVLKGRDLEHGDPIERHGVLWSAEPLDVSVGEPECGQKYPRTVSYSLPADGLTAGLRLAWHLRCSEDVPQGRAVGTLRITSPQGVVFQQDIRAGVEIADQGLIDPDVRQRARHRAIDVFDAASPAPTYLLSVDLPAPTARARLEIQSTTAGWLELQRLTVVDDQGHQHPQHMPELVLQDEARWRRHDTIYTSATSDRTVDESSENEQPYVTFENLTARPRAWVTTEIVPLSERDQLRAAHFGYLPNGQRFDPRRMALVDAGPLAPRAWQGEASSRVTRATDGAFSIAVATTSGGFLVLSEGWYPGWQARVDGTAATIYHADVSLQGIVLPPGQHTVTFSLVSPAFQVGAATSVLALLTCAVLGLRAMLRT